MDNCEHRMCLFYELDGQKGLGVHVAQHMAKIREHSLIR